LRRFSTIAALFAAGMPVPAAAADWKAVEQVKTYSVSGATGMELYDSIGANGPSTSMGTRAIAHTTFDLKWTRKYVPDGTTCRVAVNRPSTIVITYTLPKPKGRLDPVLAARWKVFYDGIAAHERVHGEHIKAMVQRIIDTTVGFEMPDDPGCRKIREALKVPLKAASDEQRQKGRDFDRVEMGDGGNVHQLVLGLVNGD
jgi:predicted secreted Zn-dependent protease